jgi:transcriptional regulator with XRE-family HTH domain
MPYKSRKPDPAQGKKLLEYLRSYMDKKGLSIRELAFQTDLSPTYMAEVMRGEKVPDASICKLIADKLNIPQFTIFKLAGWIDEGSQEMVISRLKELSFEDAEIQVILKIIDENPKRKREILNTIIDNLNSWDETDEENEEDSENQ